MYLHWDRSYETYNAFFNQLRLKIDVLEIHYNLDNFLFGSDEEKALRKSISACFATSKQIWCSRHIRENVGNYLANKVGLRNTNEDVFNLFFGETGVATANDTISFDQRMSLLQAEIVELQSPKATKYIDHVPLNIKEFVKNPHRELHSESL